MNQVDNPFAECSAPVPIKRAVWRVRGGDVIYFVGVVGGPIKIGRTNNLRRRMVELRTTTKQDLQVWAMKDGRTLEEGLYHHRFAADRIEGEWFAPSPALMAEIARLRDLPSKRVPALRVRTGRGAFIRRRAAA